MQRLFPVDKGGKSRPVQGLYLQEAVHHLGSNDTPFVYGNFVSSLDGRIALLEPESGHAYLPGHLTSANDFRLFLELHAQADCLITHGGYLRALAAGRLGNILQVGVHEQHTDLLAWRKDNDLSPQPALVVVSASLDFPIPASINAHQQAFYIATTERADTKKVQALEQQGFHVFMAGQGSFVEGKPLIQALQRFGYRCIYLIAGPVILETMLRDQQLSRLYLTTTHQMLGGQGFHTLIPGSELDAAGQLSLSHLYYDSGCSQQQKGQFFARYECGTAQ